VFFCPACLVRGEGKCAERTNISICEPTSVLLKTLTTANRFDFGVEAQIGSSAS